MATIKELYDLVRSLDKLERKSLSILIEGTAGKAKRRYHKSLEIINKEKVFDAVSLSKKLERHVTGMNLSEANTNFYNFICRNLHLCVNTSTVNLGLLKELMLADIFIAKRLTEQAEKMLKHTSAKAEESRSYGILHNAFAAEQQMDVLSTARQQNYEGRIELLEKRISYLSENMEYLGFRKLSIRFFAMVKEVGDPRNKAQQEKYTELLRHPLLSNNEKVNTYPALLKFEYYNLKCMVLSACNYLEEAYEVCKQAVEILEKPFLKQKRFDSLQNLMLTQLTFSLEMEDISKMEESSKQLLSIKPLLTNKSRIATLNEKVFYAQLLKCLKQHEYNRGIEIFESHVADEQPNGWKHSPMAYIDYLMGARLYFLSGDAEKALDCLMMIQDKEKVMRPTPLITYKFLSLLCHYRLKNYLYLSNATTALYKFLYKMEGIHAPEKALLQFLKYAGDYNKWQKGMEKLHQKFTELADDPFHKVFFTYGDYVQWLEIERKRKKI